MWEADPDPDFGIYVVCWFSNSGAMMLRSFIIWGGFWEQPKPLIILLKKSLGREDPLEKEMATYSSTFALKIPWTEEPGTL